MQFLVLTFAYWVLACISFVYIDGLLINSMFYFLDSLVTNLVLKSIYFVTQVFGITWLHSLGPCHCQSLREVQGFFFFLAGEEMLEDKIVAESNIKAQTTCSLFKSLPSRVHLNDIKFLLPLPNVRFFLFPFVLVRVED